MNAILNNHHFQRIAAALLECFEKRSEMEQNFSMDIVDEYSNIKQRMIELTAELLKADIKYTIKEESLFFDLQGKEISVSLKQLKQYLGEAEYEFFFSKLAVTTESEETVSSNNETMALIMLMNSLQKEKEELVEENRRLIQSNKALKAAAQKDSKWDSAITRQQMNTLKHDNEMLQKEKEEILSKNAVLSAEIERLTSSAASLEVESLKKENDRLYQLAYFDAKTKVLNANAFNRDFHELEITRSVFAMVSICKMRLLNEVFGRGNGDKAIAKVASELSALLPSGRIYRIMGDKFNIIFPTLEISYHNIYSAIANLKIKLSAEQIEIVFGVASGMEFQNKGDIIQAVEKMMNEMKNNEVVGDMEWRTEEKDDAPTPRSTELSAEALMDQYLNSNDLREGEE